MDERRAHPRHDLSISIEFRHDGTQATTRDLSVGGCAVLAPRLRLVNERLKLGLRHPKTREELDVVGEVKRAVPLPNGSFLLGVQFVDVDDALRARIVAFVGSLSPPPKIEPADEASRLASESADAEHAGNVPLAIRLLDQACAAAPKRADIRASRARLAAQTGDSKGAANFAKQAAELDPGSTVYAQLYQRFSVKEAGAPATSSSSTASPPAPLPAKRQSFLPRDRRSIALVAAGGVAAFALAGGNLWYWVLRHAASGPAQLDPRPYRELVPMTALFVREGRAYGTVGADWNTLGDRERRVRELAEKLRGEGVRSLYLSDSSSGLVATYKDGAPRLFE